jgi:hypothetical protein
MAHADICAHSGQGSAGTGKHAIDILKHDMVTEHGFINGMIKATHPTMSKGPALNALNTKLSRFLTKL